MSPITTLTAHGRRWLLWCTKRARSGVLHRSILPVCPYKSPDRGAESGRNTDDRGELAEHQTSRNDHEDVACFIDQMPAVTVGEGGDATAVAVLQFVLDDLDDLVSW